MRHRKLWIGIVLFIIAGAVMLIPPMIGNYGTPSWGEDGSRFLYLVSDALEKYSLEHGGKLPPTLASLYPEYMNDKRVLEQTPLFGKTKPFSGRRMAIIYWHPPRLGSAHTPVAQLVLDPSGKTDYPWRSRVLWGDGDVGLGDVRRK